MKSSASVPPVFREVFFSDKDIPKTVQELEFPLIFKSVDSSGSRGIIRVNSIDEFDDAIAYVRENTHKDYFLVEEFIEGEEFGAQAFAYDGNVSFILPHGDYVYQGDTGVPVGHYAPYQLSEEVIEDAKIQLRRAVKAMGLDNCAINADFILKNDKTYVLEIGGRCGATCLQNWSPSTTVLITMRKSYAQHWTKIRTSPFKKPRTPNASHLLHERLQWRDPVH